MSLTVLRWAVVAACFGLIALGIAWETWLAPLRPGAWLLALKVVPLALALPALAAGRVRAYQWWSMLILGYLAEGLVRSTSDTGHAVVLAILETVLAALAFTGILLYVHFARRHARPPPASPNMPARAPARPPSPAPRDR